MRKEWRGIKWLPLGVIATGSMVMAADDEIVVTASRREAKVFDSPYTITVVDSEQIQSRRLNRTMPDILSEEPAVMVQKTSMGQGSPYLRGFTGFRNVLLIDGIRLNNSTFRDGPNQYWNTVDPFTIGRLEMVKGPASVLYGSDAIGGAVNVISRNGKIPLYPPLEKGELKGGLFQPRAYYRYASANDSGIARAEVKGNTTNLNYVAGGSFKDFNDLNGGRQVGLQPKTGYDDNSADLRAEYLISNNSSLTIAHQNVRQDNAWRTHRTIYGVSWQNTTVGTDRELFYDQNRQLTYVQYEHNGLFSFSEKLKASASYQVQSEDEVRVRSNGNINRQGFDVRTTGFWLQSESPVLKTGKIVAGIEYYNDIVDSYRRDYNSSGSLTNLDIQGPVADNATYNLMGVFAQDELSIRPDLDLTAGLRYTRAETEADKVKDPSVSTPTIIALSGDWSNVVASARLLYRLNKDTNLFGGISQGFRAPNLSDLTRYDIAQSGQQEIPNVSLKPEKFISYEVGLKLRGSAVRAERVTADHSRQYSAKAELPHYKHKWQAQASVFYTTVQDMIMRYPTGNMIGANYEVQKANIGNGYIQGFEARADYQLDEQWSLFSGVAAVYGEADTYPTSAQTKDTEPMNKIQPLQEILGARWNENNYWFEALVKAADRQDKLSAEDKLDTQRIPPKGTPGYAVVNIRGGLKVNQNAQLSMAVENIANRDYRIHGSGTNEPGTNFIMAIDGKF